MRKFFVLIFLLFSLNFFPISPSNNLNLIKITVLDSLTRESLCGVKVRFDDKIYYSDFNGQIKIEKSLNNKINFSLISYKEKTDTIKNIILLNKL